MSLSTQRHRTRLRAFERVNIGHHIPDFPITEHRPRRHRGPGHTISDDTMHPGRACLL
jgi:hypothetical protein